MQANVYYNYDDESLMIMIMMMIVPEYLRTRLKTEKKPLICGPFELLKPDTFTSSSAAVIFFQKGILKCSDRNNGARKLKRSTPCTLITL